MVQETVLITGANRGIGLEFVHQHLNKGNTVHATYRSDKGGLESVDHPGLTCHAVDVRFDEDVKAMMDAIGSPIDVLINNAGVADGRWSRLESIDFDMAIDVLHVNALAPIRVTQHASPWLKDGSKVVMISSLMGSIADCESGRSYAYRASKTALNMFTVAMKNELAQRGVAVLLLHPGWVQTDMGGAHAPVDVQTSVNGMMQRIKELNLANTGTYVQFDGTPVPW